MQTKKPEKRTDTLRVLNRVVFSVLSTHVIRQTTWIMYTVYPIRASGTHRLEDRMELITPVNILIREQGRLVVLESRTQF